MPMFQMMIVALFASAILLLLAFAVFFKQDLPRIMSGLLFGFAGLIVAGCLGGSTAILAQTVCCVVLLCVVKKSHPKWAFVAESCGLTGAVYGVLFFQAWRERETIQALRETTYAFESLEDRLPARNKDGASSRLGDEGKAELRLLSDRLEWTDNRPHRDRALRYLHNKTLEEFVGADGFGVFRARNLKLTDLVPHEDTIIAQPGSLGDIVGQEMTADYAPNDKDKLKELHRASQLDFLNPRGFGYIKSRAEVAGFQSHFFRKIPESSWRVRSIELVGLVVHKEPIVYVTANLPRMEELRKAPTRPLDLFEANGLASLKQGETLYVHRSTLGVRMLGAIRAVEKCVECHGGQEGDLLGAFSYALAEPPEKTP